MTSGVNLYLTNWQKTGQSPRVDQYTVDINLQWKDDQGQERSWSGVATFPNDLALVPADWLKEELENLIIRAARKRLGID